MASQPEVVCRNADCHVAAGGACAEGITPREACPYFGRPVATEPDLDDEDTDDAAGEAALPTPFVPLPAGESLTAAQLDAFLRRRAITLVTLVGDRDSGKTTLACALYDRVLRGAFAGHRFTASETLVALERRSHYARVASGRAIPDTARTSLADGVRFFHLGLTACSAPHVRRDLMLSDRAGETYRQARDSSQVVPTLVEVEKADRVVLLLDGARVAAPVERAGALQSVRQMLRALLDGGALHAGSRVQVVTTKLDLLRAAEAATNEPLQVRIKSFHDRLRDDFVPHVADLAFAQVASRDPTGSLAPAFGLDALVDGWLAAVPMPRPARRAPDRDRFVTEFDRLLLRTPMPEDA